MSQRDTHPVCADCLGFSHAQAVLSSTDECIHCAILPRKVLRRRFNRQANASGKDPLVSGATAEKLALQVDADMSVAPAETPGPSWAELAPSPPDIEASDETEGYNLSRLVAASSKLEEVRDRNGGESDDSDVLWSDEDEEEDSFEMRGAAKPPGLEGDTQPRASSPSPLEDLDMHDMCKRAANRLNIPWPVAQAETPSSRFDGKRLRKAKKSGKQTLPFFPELLDEIAVTWKNRPYTEKHPILGSSLLDCEGMKSHGLHHMPLVEPLVASHLQPETSTSPNPPLPHKADRFQSSLTDKCYKAAALSARALNASALLSAYQAELEEDMTVKPDNALWEEICVVTDHVLRLHKIAVQATGRAMGLMVLQERTRWLGLTNLTTKEKEELLDTPIVPQGLFGAAVTSMQKRCEEKKRDDEALKLCLPRKTQPAVPKAPQQSYAQTVSRPVAAFKIPKVPQAATSQAPRGPKNPWARKNAPQARPQATPPPPTATVVVRKKKRLA